MKIYNLMEEVVISAINGLIEKENVDMCTCEKCKLDVAAIALNNLQPKYIVSGKGKLFERVNQMSYQFEADVTREVVKAMKIVANKPKHEDVVKTSEK